MQCKCVKLLDAIQYSSVLSTLSSQAGRRAALETSLCRGVLSKTSSLSSLKCCCRALVSWFLDLFVKAFWRFSTSCMQVARIARSWFTVTSGGRASIPTSNRQFTTAQPDGELTCCGAATPGSGFLAPSLIGSNNSQSIDRLGTCP